MELLLLGWSALIFLEALASFGLPILLTFSLIKLLRVRRSGSIFAKAMLYGALSNTLNLLLEPLSLATHLISGATMVAVDAAVVEQIVSTGTILWLWRKYGRQLDWKAPAAGAFVLAISVALGSVATENAVIFLSGFTPTRIAERNLASLMAVISFVLPLALTLQYSRSTKAMVIAVFIGICLHAFFDASLFHLNIIAKAGRVSLESALLLEALVTVVTVSLSATLWFRSLRRLCGGGLPFPDDL